MENWRASTAGPLLRYWWLSSRDLGHLETSREVARAHLMTDNRSSFTWRRFAGSSQLSERFRGDNFHKFTFQPRKMYYYYDLLSRWMIIEINENNRNKPNKKKKYSTLTEVNERIGDPRLNIRKKNNTARKKLWKEKRNVDWFIDKN